MNQPYRIKYVADDLLCDGLDFLLCAHDVHGVTLFIRQGVRDLPDAENERVFEEAWAAYREWCDTAKMPRQREYQAG